MKRAHSTSKFQGRDIATSRTLAIARTFNASLPLSVSLAIVAPGIAAGASGQASYFPGEEVAYALEVPAIPIDTLRSSIAGKYSGRFDCGSRRQVSLEITASGPPSGKGVPLVGKFDVASGEQGSGKPGPEIRSLLKGDISPWGIVRLSATPPESLGQRPQPTTAGVLSGLKSLFGRTNPSEAAPKASDPVFRPFDLILIRAQDGGGLVGTPFSDKREFECRELVLRKLDSPDTSSLPVPHRSYFYGLAQVPNGFAGERGPVQETAANSSGMLARAVGLLPPVGEAPQDGPNQFGGLLWLKYASQLGHRGAAAVAAKMYELGKGTEQDYEQAAKYYRLGADQGDARGQAGLSRLLSQGLGIPRNEAEGRRVASLANSTNKTATAVCRSPAMLSTIGVMFRKFTATSGALAGLVTGQSISAGDPVLARMEADFVSTLADPFQCTATVTFVDASVADSTEFREWATVTRDAAGNQLYYHVENNSSEVLEGQLTATIFGSILRTTPSLARFLVIPRGPGRYEVGMMLNDLGVTSLRYATTISLQ